LYIIGRNWKKTTAVLCSSYCAANKTSLCCVALNIGELLYEKNDFWRLKISE